MTKPRLTFNPAQNTGLAESFTCETATVVLRGEVIATLHPGCPCGCPEYVFTFDEVSGAVMVLLRKIEEL
jgi:hypothetical protein